MRSGLQEWAGSCRPSPANRHDSGQTDFYLPTIKMQQTQCRYNNTIAFCIKSTSHRNMCPRSFMHGCTARRESLPDGTTATQPLQETQRDWPNPGPGLAPTSSIGREGTCNWVTNIGSLHVPDVPDESGLLSSMYMQAAGILSTHASGRSIPK